MTRSIRLYLVIGAAVVVLLGGGIVVGIQLLRHRIDHAIPQADLFGSSSPSASATGQPSASPTPTGPPGKDISGPLNVLIVGVDTRTASKNWPPHADAVMMLHVNADHTKAYLTSLPRDLVVNIPAFAPARFGGERSKLTHSMTFGARVPGTAKPNPVQGFQLVARTVSNYTGITRWDAGAVLQFNGLKRVVDAIGGIDLYVDQKVVSIHLNPAGHGRPVCSSCAHGYGGPQATYTVGTHHFVGWQALDYSRQRYLPGGDYTRQRHQRQVVKAMISKIMTTSFVTDPLAIDRLFRALGTALIFDGRGHSPIDFAFTLRTLRSSAITSVGLPGTGAYSGGHYIGENLNAIEAPFFAAWGKDALDSFLAAHPSLVNADRR